MMEFEEEHEEEEEEEEDSELAITPTFKKQHHQQPPHQPPSTTARYRECLKNHAVGMGGHAVDGCGEFMPAGIDGSLDALRCAACNCHRNFHRKEFISDNTLNISSFNQQLTLYTPRPHHTSGPQPQPQQHLYQFYPYNRTTTAHGGGGFRQLAMTITSSPTTPPAPPPEAHKSGEEGVVVGSGGDNVVGIGGTSMMMMSGGSSGSGKKRFRTKFTQEQKDKMLCLAEKVGWKIQKQDENLVQQFCHENGVKRHVLKVWMHNNKHTLGKKP